MADTRLLLEGLDVYHESLTRNSRVVADEFDKLNYAWESLNELYQGTAADEFRPIFQQSAANFQIFLESAEQVQRLLAQRVEHLREADRGGLLS